LYSLPILLFSSISSSKHDSSDWPITTNSDRHYRKSSGMYSEYG